MSIEAARRRDEPLDHVLFSGPPGLGKTSQAHIITLELGVNLRVTSGPAIERPVIWPPSQRSRQEGRTVHRRDPSSRAGGRRDSLSRDGGLRAKYCGRERAGSSDDEARGQAVHDGRGDDPLRTAEFSSA
jgi:hypothetical protein